MVALTPRWVTRIAEIIEVDVEHFDLTGFEDEERNRLPPSVRVGAIASGEKIIHQATHLEEMLGGWGGVLAVEMEGAGVGEAVSMSGKEIPLVVVRGIADFAESQQIKGGFWIRYAANSAVYVAERLARQLAEHHAS